MPSAILISQNYYEILSQVSTIVSDNARSPSNPVSAIALKKRQNDALLVPILSSRTSRSSTCYCDCSKNKLSHQTCQDCFTQSRKTSIVHRQRLHKSSRLQPSKSVHTMNDIGSISAQMGIQESVHKDTPPRKPRRRLSIEE
jgi:hypothetical protein